MIGRRPLGWLYDVVRRAWRYLAARLPRRRPLARAAGGVTVRGRLDGDVAYCLRSPARPDIGGLSEEAAALVAESRQRFESGQLFEPLRAAAERGAVIGARVTENARQRHDHLLFVYPRDLESGE
jgi:hypothetical protein